MTGGARRDQPDAIDWASARERLDRVARVVAGDARRTPEQVRAVLEARARALATPLLAEEPADALDVLIFSVSEDRYAIESRFVFAVLRLEHISLLPGAEAPVVGLTSWRGDLLTLFDLRALTGTSGPAVTDLGWVVVLGDRSAAFGVLVDTVRSVETLPRAAIRPLSGRAGAAREYLLGVTDDAVLVLDAAGLTRINT